MPPYNVIIGIWTQKMHYMYGLYSLVLKITVSSFTRDIKFFLPKRNFHNRNLKEIKTNKIFFFILSYMFRFLIK